MNHPEDSGLIDKYIASYLTQFPLRAACSLEVINRNVSFIEEYIFPQQLLLWVRENNSFDGTEPLLLLKRQESGVISIWLCLQKI